MVMNPAASPYRGDAAGEIIIIETGSIVHFRLLVDWARPWDGPASGEEEEGVGMPLCLTQVGCLCLSGGESAGRGVAADSPPGIGAIAPNPSEQGWVQDRPASGRECQRRVRLGAGMGPLRVL